MTTMEQIPTTYDQAIRVLAQWQGESGEADLKIFAFPDTEGRVVRLAHVSEGIADRGGIRIFKMGMSKEFPFTSVIALTVPKYWDQIIHGEPLLPPDWDIATRRQVWPDERA
jgi:hypothetical protein